MSCISQLPRRAAVAVVRVVGEVELHDAAAQLRDLLGLRCARPSRRRTGVVHEAGDALGARRSRPGTSGRSRTPRSESVAHSLGIVDAGLRGGAQHGRARRGRRPRGRRWSRRRSLAATARRCRGRARELVVMTRTPSGCRSKSSGQCCSALCTGIGVRPPIAHSEPSVMVSHRSSRSTRFAATSCPAMIRSIVSTPRAEPIRHGRALAARLRRAELHREPRHPGHVDGVVEDDDAAVADHRAGLGERLVVHRQVELLRRQVGAERAADLDRAHRAAAERAAAVVRRRARPG